MLQINWQVGSQVCYRNRYSKNLRTLSETKKVIKICDIKFLSLGYILMNHRTYH